MAEKVSLAIIGGGPAGMAAAVGAYEAGVRDTVILERDTELGGILNQCIHNGFGLHTFKEELTGPEYADRYIRKVVELGIPYKLSTIVADISKDREILYVNPEEGAVPIRAGAVILAMGCRERPRGALGLPGYRPAGIYTAGTAQRLMNIEGKKVGKEVVILGSGDIGLIMARRMTLEGAHVQVVAELLPFSGGLKRNIVQCLDDYGIPLKLSHTVTCIHGKERVTGVTISEVGPDRRPVPGTESEYACDTLLLSCGLLPENELSKNASVPLSPVTGGPEVDDRLQTAVPGIFACGNVLHVHDLVDFVSGEAELAGRNAVEYLRGNGGSGTEIPVLAQNGVRYTVPQRVHAGVTEGTVTVRFRVGDVYKNKCLCVYAGDRNIRRIRKRILVPGEMGEVILKCEDYANLSAGQTVRVTLED